MRSQLRSSLAVTVLALSGVDADGSENRVPALISPVGETEALIRNDCPTFSWTGVEGAVGYQLEVFAATERAPGLAEQPVVRVDLPGGAFSWTPSLENCLRSPGRYAWLVGAKARGESAPAWSQPAIFRLLPSSGRPDEPPSRRLDAPPPLVSPPPARPSLDLATAPLIRSVSSAAAYAPPSCTAGLFTDVPPGDFYCPWIEQLARDGILVGCGGGKYCPENPVTREQLALYLGRSMHGSESWRPAPLVTPPGVQISTLDSAGNVGAYTSITIGADGLGLISYLDVTNFDLKVAHCSDLECTAATTTTLDVPGADTESTGHYTSIALGSDGLGVISYYYDLGGPDADLRVAHCSNLLCTSATITTVDLAGPDVNNTGTDTSIVIGPDGFPLVSYRSITDNTLKVAHCLDVFCSTSNRNAPQPGGQGSSITIGSDGLALISQGVGVHHCADANCTTASALAIGAGMWPSSIAVGADGLGILAHYNPGTINVVHCSDLTCSAVTSVFLASGDYPTLTIGGDGLPVVAFGGSGGLQVAHCTDVKCTNASIATVDGTALVFDPAVTVGTDGLPLISYQLAGAFGDLRVVHCSNVFCAPYLRRR